MRKFVTALSAFALLSACGGGGGDSPRPPVAGEPIGVVPPPPPPPSSQTPAGCSVRERQNWVGGQINEWYLFPETLPANRTPTQSTVEDYIDSLTATARAQGRDRFFTYLTSITEENAFFNSGSSAGFGFRLSLDSANRRLFVSESFEGAPALAVGIDRGTEIVAIGTSASDLRTAGLNAALGPPDVGVTRVLRITDAAGTRDVTVRKADFELTPVSSRYGAKVIEDGGKRVGYVNLRTFISTADPALRAAFQNFRNAGITEVVVDFRYNGGGLVSIANLMGDLLGRDRSTQDIFSITAFRPEKSSNNSTRFFNPQPQSIAPTRLAFIGTGGTASASELVINSMIPYLRERSALIGTNTFGKPVGQIALDRDQCDDRLRVVAFATQNAERQGDYFQGLANKVGASCRAADDITRPMGDPQEASTRSALDFLAGRSCAPITSGGGQGGLSVSEGERRALLTPDRPSTVQREVPGAF
jgi:C-terminal processing protease CtpA/Prc